MLVALVATACTGGGSEGNKAGREEALRGGTLRVGIPEFLASSLTNGVALDPQKASWYDSFELFRCCLIRTLLNHEGVPTERGGSTLRPDLAASLPEVSPNGLTWTFRIKPGLRYAPPFQGREIVAQDFIRALEREANPRITSYTSSFYSVIRGFDEFAAGRADSISGLSTPNEHTLAVHLEHPEGDLGELLALPAASPLPPGAADGHLHDYGRFLAASGPYMIQGSPDLDPSAPPAEQRPVSGYVPKRSITLVRNPSWHRSTDGLRPAYADRIEIKIGGTPESVAKKVDSGALDVMVFMAPAPQLPPQVFRKYTSTPRLRSRLLIGTRDFLRYVEMNLAVPPFDDIHVRKAVNYAIDKDALVRIFGGASAGRVTGHLVLDSLEDDLLQSYDPYGPDHSGNLAAAQREMRESRYDQDGDGSCDGPACRVRALAFNVLVFPQMARMIKADLAQIGIDLHVRLLPSDNVFARTEDPTAKVPMSLSGAWGKDTLNAEGVITSLFSRAGIGQGNESLVGATPAQLSKWGYAVHSVPSAEDRIDSCLPLVGQPQVQCWAAVDQYLMERVVPWVPYVVETNTTIVSGRVRADSFDQSASLPALDRFVVSG